MAPLSSFRYSGNKSRMLDSYLPIPQRVRRIVEPYLGSGSYSMNSTLPFVGMDFDPNVVDLWHWLQSSTPEDLRALNEKFEEITKRGKVDIRTCPELSRGEMLYLKINACSLVVGQWSGWSLYPQNTLPVDKTIRALSRIKEGLVYLGRAGEFTDFREGDLIFVDPPYLGTDGNYAMESSYSPVETTDLVLRASAAGCDVIFTYGDSAQQVFPMFKWELCEERLVPNMRRGGTVSRREHVAYLGEGWNEGIWPF